MKLLIVDDDAQLAQAISFGLKDHYIFDTASTGRKALSLAKTGAYAAILLDVELPEMNGFEICKKLRQSGNTTPIIILSGRFNSVDSKVQGLDYGADDYLTKPFSIEELAARIRALLRRKQKTGSKSTLELGDLSLDLNERTVTCNHNTIPLKRKEFDLLEYFLRNPNRVLTREMIFDHVWDSNANSFTNTVDVHVKFLRDKVERPFSTSRIQTIHGLGYKLVI